MRYWSGGRSSRPGTCEDGRVAGAKILVSVCKGSECRDRGADELQTALVQCLREHDLEDGVRVARGGCWGLCNLGANVVVRHDAAADAIEKNKFGSDATFAGKIGEYHYKSMTVEKARRMCEEHLRDGRPASDLLSTADDRKTAVKLSK